MKTYGRYTIEELQAYFTSNKLSESFVPQVDFEQKDNAEVEVYQAVTKTLNSAWDPLSRDMGLKSSPKNYSDDNPLMAMRNGLGNMLAEQGINLLDGKGDQTLLDMVVQLAEKIDNEETANELLQETVEMAMQVLQYPDMAKVVQQNPMYEDFNHKQYNNFPARDFNKQFHHTRASTKTVSLDQIQQVENEHGELSVNEIADRNENIQEEVETKLASYDFWNSLSEQDKQILDLKMQGKTQSEIAEALGYKTHSAVGKRLTALKEKLFKTVG